eukprot:TRINITY_DN8293_c0_g1_i1.p1 TRINITY_DN8293_c0_g1~~TRINITY_DN8293_c0_g1_i1.p1  ORF type:complete len:608 (+),score=62.28 TRINITY_DN8293_c0_g1_i1:114-1937(+)
MFEEDPLFVDNVRGTRSSQSLLPNHLQLGDTIVLKGYNAALGAWSVEKNGVPMRAHAFIKFEPESPTDIAADLYSMMVNPFKSWALLNESRDSKDPKPSKRRKKRGSNAGTGQVIQKHPHQVSDTANGLMLSEIDDTKSQLQALQVELQVIIKAFHQMYSDDLSESPLGDFQVQKTPDELVFSKLLENAFATTTIADGKEKNNDANTKLFTSLTDRVSVSEVALAPAKIIPYKYLLNSNLNPNVISMEDMRTLETLDFDVLSLSNADSVRSDMYYPLVLLMHMFNNLGLSETFSIPQPILERFLMTVFFRYRDVPFHNFYHAFNVTHTMYYFLHACQAGNCLSQLEMLAMVISALTHDCDHPGLNNSFQHKARTRVSLLHQKSTLENHHLLQCMQILSLPECNILLNLDASEKEAIKLYIRHLILATDLSLHGVVHRKLVERKKQVSKQVYKKGSLDEEDRILIMVSLMKCSDLSNEIRPVGISQKWANRVLMEFFAQAQKEGQLNLPITPFMDQHKVIIAKEQMNFISHLCMPLYENLAVIFPTLNTCVEQLNYNRSQWEKRLNTFFLDNPEEEKKLSNKSLWDDTKQVKSSKVGLKNLLSSRSEK